MPVAATRHGLAGRSHSWTWATTTAAPLTSASSMVRRTGGANARALGCQTLLEDLRIGKPDRAEPGLLVEAQDDSPTAGLVRQRAQGRGQRGRQPTRGGLDLDLDGVATRAARRSISWLTSRGTPNVTTARLHLACGLHLTPRDLG
ncbi:hypothetical protein Ga0074812_104366 [Parafrankia irregularis]|uniref:Uncharacterized protein n=1 Tax=Parafrankia irregularis TaxID=795642 RepID=A0A0S4QI84_9ACTN|nr:hypothetical protein Ga0074812_104366 [Parafrankia irregularis]